MTSTDKPVYKFVYVVYWKGYLADRFISCYDNRKAAREHIKWATKRYPDDQYKLSKHQLYSE